MDLRNSLYFIHNISYTYRKSLKYTNCAVYWHTHVYFSHHARGIYYTARIHVYDVHFSKKTLARKEVLHFICNNIPNARCTEFEQNTRRAWMVGPIRDNREKTTMIVSWEIKQHTRFGGVNRINATLFRIVARDKRNIIILSVPGQGFFFFFNLTKYNQHGWP